MSDIHAGAIPPTEADGTEVPDYAGAIGALKESRDEAAALLARSQFELDRLLANADGQKNRMAELVIAIHSHDVAIAKLEAEGTL